MLILQPKSIIILIYILRQAIQAFDVSPIYQYYGTSNPYPNGWPQKIDQHGEKITATNLPRIKKTINTANNRQNSLNNESEDAAVTSLVKPNNPVPMLYPNPFANESGEQGQFANENYVRPGNENAPLRLEEGSFCRRKFDGRGGYCILAYQCLHVIRDYRMHNIKIDVCTYRKNVPVICCPLSDKHVESERISAKKCYEYHESIRNIRIGQQRNFSGKICVPSVPMIVGGHLSSTVEYPHMAALGWTRNSDDTKWGCGGTLISELFVLTAAHCITTSSKPPDMVRLGAVDLNITSIDQQDIKIILIIMHPKYQSTSYYHDIALIKLIKSAKFSKVVRPACLWQLPDIKILNTSATGWGRTEFLGPKSKDLQRVELNMIDQQICKDIYKTERRLPRGIIDEQLCAGYLSGGKDTCQGDSGGPLHVEIPELNCVKFVIGITSFGKFCAVANAPGVYTKIYPYLDWIEKIVF